MKLEVEKMGVGASSAEHFFNISGELEEVHACKRPNSRSPVGYFYHVPNFSM